jgi:hypothetical protein
LQLDYFIAQKSVFERRKKMGDVVFGVLLFAIELFYCSRVFFEKRKKVGDVVFSVFFVCN